MNGILDIKSLLSFQELDGNHLTLSAIEETLAPHVNKTASLESANLKIQQSVYESAQTAFEDYLETVAASEEYGIASVLYNKTVHDFIIETAQPLAQAFCVTLSEEIGEDYDAEDAEFEFSEACISMDLSAVGRTQHSLSVFFELVIGEATALYLATFCIDPHIIPSLDNEENRCFVSNADVENQLLHNGTIAAIISQRLFPGNAAFDVMKDPEYDVDVVSFATVDTNSDEQMLKYDKFLSIFDILAFSDATSKSRIYQSVKKKFPNETIQTITDAFEEDDYPLFGTVYISQEDLEEAFPELDFGDFEDSYIETFIIAPQLAFADDEEIDSVNAIAFDSLGFNFESDLVYNEESLKTLTPSSFDDDEDVPILIAGDIAINPEFSDWWQTLLIPFVRIQMEKYDDVEDIDVSKLYDDFDRFVEEKV